MEQNFFVFIFSIYIVNNLVSGADKGMDRNVVFVSEPKFYSAIQLPACRIEFRH